MLAIPREARRGMKLSNASERAGADPNDQVRRNQALDSARRFFDVVFDSAPVMLHSIDNEGNIVKVNRTWLAKLGYKESEVVGRPSTDFLTDESRARALNETLPLFWRTGSARSVGYRLVKKDGQVKDVLLDAELSRDAAGRSATLAAMYDSDDRVQWSQASATIKALQALAGVGYLHRDIERAAPGLEGTSFRASCSHGCGPGVACISSERSARLTGREIEVLRLLARGARNKEMAGELFITVHTVKFHIENLYRKLGVRARTEALRIASQQGLLQDLTPGGQRSTWPLGEASASLLC